MSELNQVEQTDLDEIQAMFDEIQAIAESEKVEEVKNEPSEVKTSENEKSDFVDDAKSNTAENTQNQSEQIVEKEQKAEVSATVEERTEPKSTLTFAEQIKLKASKKHIAEGGGTGEKPEPVATSEEIDALNKSQEKELEKVFDSKTEIASKSQSVTRPNLVNLSESVVSLNEPETLKTQSLEQPIDSKKLEKAEYPFDEKVEAKKYKYAERVLVKEFLSETEIHSNDISTALTKQNAFVAYYSSQLAQAEYEANRRKLAFEILEARLFDAYRKKLALYSDKVTEKQVENAVRMDVQWSDCQIKLFEAQAKVSTYKGFMASLKDRASSLIQLGSDRREELKGSMRMYEKSAEERAKDAIKNTLG